MKEAFFQYISDVDPLLVFLYLFFFFIILLVSEFLYSFLRKRKNWENKIIQKELLRKIPHMLFGIIFASTVFVFSQKEALIFSVLVFCAAIFSSFFHIFKSIHQIERKSYGVILFSLSMIIMIILFWNNPFAFLFGVLVLTFSDSLAAVVGKGLRDKIAGKIISQKTNIGRIFHKSWAGSITFFLISFMLLLALKGFEEGVWKSIWEGNVAWEGLLFLSFLNYFVWSALISFTLTVIEFFFIYGVDNIALPISAALLYSFL